MNILIASPLFGIFLSLAAFEIGFFIYKKTKFPLFNPLLIAIALILGFLMSFNIDYANFNKGGQFINMFLGPATVILAVPLYNQLHLLKKYYAPIFIGILVGSAAGIVSIIVLSYTLGLNETIVKSLVPKAVTTPIGMEISSGLGGIVPITVVAIVVTGIIGAVIGPITLKLFKINHPIAKGVALGTASHAVGTSKAIELGEIEGAMSSLSIGIAGLLTVLLAPFLFELIKKLF